MASGKSWVWQYFSKDEKDRSKVTCLKCKENERDFQLSFHNSTSTLINHLKHVHKLEQQGPKGMHKLTNIVYPIVLYVQASRR